MNLPRTVYIDESFFKWTSLADKRVNLAYGAVSIPDRAGSAIKKRWKAYEQLIRDLVFADTGVNLPEDGEIKFTDTRNLAPASLNKIGRFWEAFYKKNHIRVFGLFTAAEGFGNNELRNDAYESSPEEFENIVKSQEELYAIWLNNSIERRKAMKDAGKGDLGVLDKIIKNFVSCIFRFHLDTRGRESFGLVWDHRTGEAEGLKEVVEEIVDLVRKDMRLSEAELRRYYRGLVMRDSRSEIGLRYADFIAGSYRNLFRSYPDLLTDNSAFGIKSAKINDGMLSPFLPYYESPMDENLAEALLLNKQEIIFPHLIPRLAGGLFTYFTNNGDARHCRPLQKAYFDMPDYIIITCSFFKQMAIMSAALTRA